ncbi:helix-turn-helix domain-containing protein [Anaerotignum propionicum]|uniref:helix-turn-helix domain-containing protein n=1 Tax=Anaerotignum propionicum TaxID=28446 RepID=UPI00289AE563|nr:S24 family peptidase [Anaerotignum propionicum]
MYEIYRKLRDTKGCKDSDVAKATDITKSTFSDWKSGRSEPKKDKLEKIADFFEVSIDYLMTGKEPSYKLPEGAIPVDGSMFVKIPIIGSVRCGEPMFADSNIEDYEYTYIETLRGGGDFFYLRAKGDSMINAGISEGDLLLIRAQSDVDSGDIAIININGDEETLKRVIKKDKAIILQPENPAYETKIFIGKELEEIHIQGRLMSVVKKY